MRQAQPYWEQMLVEAQGLMDLLDVHGPIDTEEEREAWHHWVFTIRTTLDALPIDPEEGDE